MVEVRIIMEGGGDHDTNADVATMDNSVSLRQSLNRILSEGVNTDVSVVVNFAGGGCVAVAKSFAKQSNANCFLYVDSDKCKADVNKWLAKKSGKEPILLTDNHKAGVFFMVQEMEAWILKQPEAIELWANNNGYVRVDPEKALTDHQILRGRNVEDIEKPSDKLGVLIKVFYQKQSSGATKSKKEREVRYGKLTAAPSLLDCLDVDKLKNNDSEFNRFVSVVSQS